MSPSLAFGLLLFVGQVSSASPGSSQDVSRIRWSTEPGPVEVVEGPILLQANIFCQWGGHTFPYVLEGKERVYWAGVDAYEGPAFLGSTPKPGVEGDTVVTRIPLAGNYSRVNPPQIVRTPDEHVHIFLSTRHAKEKESGEIHYWRTRRPGDVTELVDRSSRFPTERFSDFTIRQNVGLSPDGKRIVFCNLTDFVEGTQLMNMPLVWIGKLEGGSFQFQEPVVYGGQTAFFYPQVAATDEGPVLLGAVHREPNRNAELVHLDWEGNVIGWHALPGITGESWAFDMQPLDPNDWSELAIARIQLPAEGSVRGIEFWRYDTLQRSLKRVSQFQNDIQSERSYASAGKFWIEADASVLFLNEPGSHQIVAWSDAFFAASGPVTLTPLPRTAAKTVGSHQIRSLFFPSRLQGSLHSSSGLRPVAVDALRAGVGGNRDGDRCDFLLWWLRRR